MLRFSSPSLTAKPQSDKGYTITPAPTLPEVMSLVMSQLLVIFADVRAWSKSVSISPASVTNNSSNVKSLTE